MPDPKDRRESRSHVVRSGEPGEIVPAWQASAYSSEEIDLVDIGVLFWRRRWLMLAVFLVFLALTIVGTIIKSPTYEYTSTIQLGSITTTQGSLLSPESPEGAASVLQNVYIPAAIVAYQAEHDVNLRTLKVTASAGAAGNGTNFVVLSCKVKTRMAPACVEIEKTAAASYVQGNSRAINALRANLGSQLATAKLTLTAVQSPDVFAVQEAAAKQAIASAQNALTNLQTTESVFKVSQMKTEAAVKLNEQQAAQLKQHIDQVRKAAITSGQAVSNPTQAMSNLVLGTQVQDSVNLLNRIEQRLAVTLPEQLATINKNLADNARDQGLQRQVIEQNKLALKKLLFDHSQDIEKQQANVDNLQSQITNIADNRVLGEPLRSMNPVGLSRAAVFGLGLIISIILAILAAFVANYVESVRLRLHSPA